MAREAGATGICKAGLREEEAMQKRGLEECESWAPRAQCKTPQGLPDRNCCGAESEREILEIDSSDGCWKSNMTKWKDLINTFLESVVLI